MKTGDTTRRTLIVYDILRSLSDSAHILSMNDILDELDLRGLSADRRTVYSAIHALQETGYDIRYTRSPRQGYWLEHTFSPAEALILSDAVRSSPALSPERTEILLEKLLNGLSDYQKDELQNTYATAVKTDNEDVLNNIGLIQSAIAQSRTIRFRYYDLTLDRRHAYRRNGAFYTLDPYAIVSSGGRFYCAAYSRDHSSFSPYRIDKMEHLELTEDRFHPLPFRTEDWLRSSFNMYTGEPRTITCDFDNDLASIVFDRFGTDIIISEVTDTHFRASIRTALTPTLISWILQFPGRITVIHPDDLKEELLRIAETLVSTYRKDSHEQKRKD